ncbi:MAG: SDR family oxidoreductase [Deltaproteobacteria bacterium]|nr:SDR family oxidoreductase [Deltaproteobacteria bacterium]
MEKRGTERRRLMTFTGHTALITGAAQGIGRACAEALASRGAEVVLVDKNSGILGEVTETIRKQGGLVTACAFDLMEIDDLPSDLDKLSRSGTVDILVNNAGFDRPGTTARIDREDFESVVGIHLTVPLLLIKLFLPGMRAAGWGRIINVSSIYGLIGGKGEVAYSAAKAGIIGLTKSVAKECGKDGVTVNAVLPGLTRTPTIEKFMADQYKEMIIAETPLGRIGEAKEVAAVIAFLASEDASFITGAAVPVSGGWGI